ncbi:MAG: outer membrane transport protein [Betaproteobacteria bacterium]|nr:MAG: outer membrane transport protein [Betaproteobacteria bacterium]
MSQHSLALAAAALALLAHSDARAAFTENLGTSPIAMSLGNAVTADPPGIDAIHFNPAGLARITHNTKSDSIFGASIKPYASFTKPAGFDIGGWTDDPVAGTSTGPVRQSVFIPVLGVPKARLPIAGAAGMGLAWHEADSRWTFATGIYIPQAVGIDRTLDKNDPARFDGRKVVIQRLVYLSPSAAYKLTDSLSVGVSVPIAHQGFALDTDMRFPNKLLGIIGKLQDAWCGDNGNPLDTFAFGLCGGGKEGRLRPFNKAGAMQFEMTAPADPTINLGVLWEPASEFALGATYQSGSKTVLTGRYSFEAEPMFDKFVQGMYGSLLGPVVASMFGFPTSIPRTQSGNATLVLPYPEHIQIGMKFKPIRQVQLNVDANWTNWKRWDKLTFQFDQPIALLEMARIFGQSDPSKLVIPRGYDNPVHWGFGLQVNVTESLALRAGYEPRKSSVPTSKIDLIAPLPDLKVKSLGIGYVGHDGMRIDATASYASGKFNVPADTSCNLNCTNFFNAVYNPYAGLDVSGGIRIRYFGVTISHPFD